jgi:hypothetical protein
MGNYLIFVVISLLVAALIYSSYSSLDVFARPKPNYTTIECHKARESSTGPTSNQYKCCYGEVNSKGAIQHWYCADCTKKADSSFACGDYTEVFRSPTTGQANFPQGGGVIEQPPTPKKHAGTVPPEGAGTIEQPQSSNHSPKDNTKLPNGSVEQQPHQAG